MENILAFPMRVQSKVLQLIVLIGKCIENNIKWNSSENILLFSWYVNCYALMSQ